MMQLNVLIAGVGGQGTLLASRVLGRYALAQGSDCKLSEVHGMSQRGGSVVTHVKMGEKVYSPVIEPGGADVLLAFEALEAARYAHYVKKGGMIIVSTQKIMPMSVVTGSAKYPGDILDKLTEMGYNVVKVDAVGTAERAGNIRAANIVMIGCMAKLLKIDYGQMRKAVGESVPQKSLEVNLKAFEEGFNAIKLP